MEDLQLSDTSSETSGDSSIEGIPTLDKVRIASRSQPERPNVADRHQTMVPSPAISPSTDTHADRVRIHGRITFNLPRASAGWAVDKRRNYCLHVPRSGPPFPGRGDARPLERMSGPPQSVSTLPERLLTTDQSTMMSRRRARPRHTH